jgi:hypothetical protein
MSITSPPSATANRFVVGILFSMERALKSQHSGCKSKTAMRDQFHYSQPGMALWARGVDIQQTRIQLDTAANQLRQYNR